MQWLWPWRPSGSRGIVVHWASMAWRLRKSGVGVPTGEVLHLTTAIHPLTALGLFLGREPKHVLFTNWLLGSKSHMAKYSPPTYIVVPDTNILFTPMLTQFANAGFEAEWQTVANDVRVFLPEVV